MTKSHIQEIQLILGKFIFLGIDFEIHNYYQYKQIMIYITYINYKKLINNVDFLYELDWQTDETQNRANTVISYGE